MLLPSRKASRSMSKGKLKIPACQQAWCQGVALLKWHWNLFYNWPLGELHCECRNRCHFLE